MSDVLYPKEMECPICKTKFASMKLKSKAAIVIGKDDDFCTYYKDFNPMYYEIFVCTKCGYAASENSFLDLTGNDIKILQSKIIGRSVARNFCGLRSIYDALDSYKLALHTANLRNAKDSIIAGLCLKIAWIYRYQKDEKEIQFLNYALKYYYQAFNKETSPIGNLNEITMNFLLGELSRRVGKLNDAISYFNNVVKSPERLANPEIERTARELWFKVKKQLKGEVK